MPRIPSSFRNNLIDRVIRELNPGAEDAIFPRTLEDAAIFVYSGRPSGMEWRSGQMVATTDAGAAGVTIAQDGLVARTGLRYYHAISAFHDDVTARRVNIQILQGGIAVDLAADTIAQGQRLVVLRPIVVGEQARVRAIADAIGVGSIITLRTYSANQGLGTELPGL